MSKSYPKQPLTFAQQAQQLIDRGMIVEDRALLEQTLSQINYYRMSAYWYSFRQRDAQNKVIDLFKTGASFKDVITLYEFDRNLRLQVIDAIERIEITLRTRTAYVVSHKYGAFGHTDANNFHPRFKHGGWLEVLEEESTRSKEAFVLHYQQNYTGFPILPIWMATEVMSLGSLSRLYQGLNPDDKRAVAAPFNIHHKRLEDWLHILTYVRNVCAHHSRLWNRELAIRPDATRDKLWQPPVTPRTDRIFYILLVMRQLLKVAGNGCDWQQNCTKLITPIATKVEWQIAMGLPNNWQKHPLWV